MRILIVYNRYITSGGEDTYFYGLVRTLRSHGHTVKTYIKESNTLANNPLKQLITASSLL